MKKQFRIFTASALLCLMLTISALAGDTPISNLTDGDTPISNVAASKNPGSTDNSTYEFTKHLASEFLSFFLNLK